MRKRNLLLLAVHTAVVSCTMQEQSSEMLAAKKIEKPVLLPYTANVILVGETGCGKTSLLNKLCGTFRAVGKGKESITRELSCVPVNCGNYSLNIVDTPGTDSKKERYKHGTLLYHALTTKPYNAILAVVKLNERYDKMTDSYISVVEPLEDYEKNVIILVSHFGEPTIKEDDFNPEKEKNEIIEAFESEGINNNIIFYSKSSECKPDDLADMIYGSVSNLKKINISIAREDFNFAYDIYISTCGLDKFKKKCNKTLKVIHNDFLKLATTSADDPNIDNILQYLSLAIREDLTAKAHEYNEKISQEMKEFDSLNMEIHLHKKIIHYTDLFLKKISERLNWKFMDRDDIRNFIKRCPNCKEVWIRTEGCDGRTDCGNIALNSGVFKKDTVKSSWWFMYDLLWEKGKRKIIKLNEPKITLNKHKLKTKKGPKSIFLNYTFDINKTDKKDNNKTLKNKVPTKRRGCGTVFTFRDLPRMKEKELLELFKVDSLDVLKDFIKSGNKRYITLRDKYESSINKSFKGGL